MSATAAEAGAERDLAALSKRALRAFADGDTGSVVSCLRELDAAQTGDMRVPYNAEVLTFYATGDAGALVRATRGLSNPLGERPPPGATVRVALSAVAAQETLDALRGAVGFVPVLNAAVLAYNAGWVVCSAKISAFLFGHVEAMEDWLALRTCFLALDVHLRRWDLAAAARVLAYLEKLVDGMCSEVEGDTEGGKGVVLEQVAPPWSGREASVMKMPLASPDIEATVRMYSARLAAAQADTKALRKDAKTAVMLSTEDGNCPTAAALLMKGRLDLNSTKSLRVLSSVHTQSPERVRSAVLPLLLNNLGVVHHRLGRHALAMFYFEKSCDAFVTLFAPPERDGASPRHPMHIMSRAGKTHVTYNLGLQKMHLGYHREALDCFATVARTDEIQAARSVMLWLRMAECCVAEANKGMSEHPISKLVGTGSCRRYVLLSPPTVSNALMRYAAQCAAKALSIIDHSPLTPSSLPEEPANRAANRQRCSALALASYATLAFDATEALTSADDLVAACQTDFADLSALGSVYGAEALCMLGRPDEAADRLAPLVGASAGKPSEPSHGGACVNAALAHCMRGDLAAAARCSRAALKLAEAAAADCASRKQAMMVFAYVSLREGNVDAARQLLSTAR